MIPHKFTTERFTCPICHQELYATVEGTFDDRGAFVIDKVLPQADGACDVLKIMTDESKDSIIEEAESEFETVRAEYLASEREHLQDLAREEREL